jgi:hypothetical protein
MRLWNWYQNLNSNLVALVFLILGAALSWGISQLFREYRDLAYTVSESPVIVYNATVTSPSLTLLDGVGNPITGTVMIETVRIWNSGNLPITQEDLRSPIRITLNPVERLLDAVVLREIEAGIANFRVTAVPSPDRAQAVVEMTWDHFDPGYGAAVQLVYEANTRPEVVLSGRVLGIREFQSQPVLAAQQRFEVTSRITELIAWIYTLSTVLIVFLRIRYRSRFEEKSPLVHRILHVPVLENLTSVRVIAAIFLSNIFIPVVIYVYTRISGPRLPLGL